MQRGRGRDWLRSGTTWPGAAWCRYMLRWRRRWRVLNRLLLKNASPPLMAQGDRDSIGFIVLVCLVLLVVWVFFSCITWQTMVGIDSAEQLSSGWSDSGDATPAR